MIRLFVFVFALFVPHFVMAQDVAASGLELVLGFVALIFLAIGIPTLISLGIRYATRSNIKTYIGCYVVILCGYLVVDQMIEGLPGGSASMIALNLLPLSMFGSFLSQWIYYLRLPKKDA